MRPVLSAALTSVAARRRRAWLHPSKEITPDRASRDLFIGITLALRCRPVTASAAVERAPIAASFDRGAAAVAVGSALLVALLFALTALNVAGLALAWENAHWTVSAAGAALLGYLGYRRSPAGERRTRGLLVAGLGLYAVGQAAWDLQVIYKIVTVPAVSDVMFLGAAVPIALALTDRVIRGLTAAERVAFALDAASVVALIGLLLVLVFGPQASISTDPLQEAVMLGYPLAFLGAAGIATLAALQLGLVATPFGLGAMIVGLALNGVAWLVWVQTAVTEIPAPGTPVNYVFSVAWLVVGVGAYGVELAPRVSARMTRFTRTLVAGFPIAASVGALAALPFIHRLDLQIMDAASIAVVAVILPGLARQALLLAERSTLAVREQQMRRAEHGERERAERALAAQQASEARYRQVVDIFGRLADQLSFAADEAQLVKAAAAAVRRLVPGTAGDVLLANSSQDRLIVAQRWGDGPTPPAGQPVDDHTPVHCLGVRRGSVYAVPDTADELTLACPVYPLAEGSLVCVPLLAVGQTIGTIHVAADRAEALDADAERQLSRVAEQVALAISNARMLRTMESMALTDPLTGLHNARFFDPLLERELAAAERAGDSLGVIVIDLDHFKRFNDTYGHQAGDEALRGFARAALAVLRDSDTFARYGGEEFVVAAPGADAEATAALAERIREAVEHATIETAAGQYAQITASFGVASTSAHGFDRLFLLKKADAALYRAKRQGRNRVVVSEPGRGARTRPAPAQAGSASGPPLRR